MDTARQSAFASSPRGRRLRVTQRRIDANRRNASRSTGPRTVEGKARVRLNAIRHGFRARDETCLAAAGDSASRLIAENTAGLTEYFHPTGDEEKAIIADIAFNAWKADRAFVLEMNSRWWEKPPGDPDWPRMHRWLSALMRYENRANRVIYRGYDALLKARRTRVKNERTNPLARRRGSLSSPASLAGEAVAARERGDGEGSATRIVRLRSDENERTNPLARRSRASGPERSEGPQRSIAKPLSMVSTAKSENGRTNPLANYSDRPARTSLRELTFTYWQAEIPRAKHAQWQK